VPREIPSPAELADEPFAHTTTAVEWTRRPSYAVMTQAGPSRLGAKVVHWAELYLGPMTFQIRDHLGLASAIDLLTRAHQSATVVFLDGADYAADPTSLDYTEPR
jgi:hypothetical protein